MKFKLVPAAPESLDTVADAQRAVPLVPGTEDDCCARLMRRVGFDSRDVARTWLTFLRALELAEETPSGFRRTDREPTRSNLRESFTSRVFAADAVLEVLGGAGEALDADEVFESVRDAVSAWERHRRPRQWEEDWRERVGHLLDWLVMLDLAEAVDGGYLAVE